MKSVHVSVVDNGICKRTAVETQIYWSTI